MAAGQASKTVNDWQTVEPNDWQEVAQPEYHNLEPTQFERERMSDVGLLKPQRAITMAMGDKSGKPYGMNTEGMTPTMEGGFVPTEKVKEALPFSAAENIFPGVGSAAHGVKRLAHGEMAGGAHEMLSGAGDALSTAIPFALEASPLTTAKVLGGGTAGSIIGSKGTEFLGATPEQSSLGGDVGGIIGGMGAGLSEPISRMSDPNRVYHSYLDPVGDVPADVPGLPRPIYNRLSTAMSRVAPSIRNRMESGGTTLSDLDNLRIEANRLGKSVYTQNSLAPDTARGMDNAAATLRDSIYPQVESMHDLPPGTLSNIKRLEGRILDVNTSSPKWGYEPTRWAPIAVRKGIYEPLFRGVARAQTLAESMRLPKPRGPFEGVSSSSPMALPSGQYEAGGSAIPEQGQLSGLKGRPQLFPASSVQAPASPVREPLQLEEGALEGEYMPMAEKPTPTKPLLQRGPIIAPGETKPPTFQPLLKGKSKSAKR